MKLIVCVDRNYGIGRDNSLLVRIPEDMKYFRATTLNKVVVMGRKTLESFPNGLPLSNRVNIVLTTNPDYSKKDAIITHSMDELDEILKDYDDDEVFVIGGESVYRALLDRCDEAYVTKVDYEYEADAFFPDLDKDDDWKLVAESEEHTYFDICYTFCVYRRK